MALPMPEKVEASDDILFECMFGGCRIVGVGDGVVVKYGCRVKQSEADSLKFVRENSLGVS